MATPHANTNPKKRNRFTSAGLLEPGIRRVRGIRRRLISAQEKGLPEEELTQLRLQLKKAKAEAKKGE